jgi:D-beta-D-heptose 7-phosphate kinase/D-beta-D-heptose 1-phosphate adenosyltransferase
VNKVFKDFRSFNKHLKIIISAKKNIVFTNGCFDLIHIGHLNYLKKARNFGDILIVGLNSDQSVKRLKGINRPIFSFDERADFLSYLDFVDYIIKFEEDTPYDLINRVMPDILVKGNDYETDDIVGAKGVIKNGGKVVTVPFLHRTSSSSIIERIKERFCK